MSIAGIIIRALGIAIATVLIGDSLYGAVTFHDGIIPAVAYVSVRVFICLPFIVPWRVVKTGWIRVLIYTILWLDIVIALVAVCTLPSLQFQGVEVVARRVLYTSITLLIIAVASLPLMRRTFFPRKKERT